MPIYEYHCHDCGLTFPKLQPMNASQQGIPCPGCQGTNTSRKLSAFASSSTAPTRATASSTCGGSSGFS